MSKDKFFEEIDEIINSGIYGFSEEALEGLKELKSNTKNKTGLTDNGKKILQYMQEHFKETENNFKSKTIGEGLFISGRSVSGSMRKLIADGYVIKISTNPVAYNLTDLGKDFQIDN